MADSSVPQATTANGADDDPTRGLPYHDKATQDLKALLQRKRMLEKTIVRSTAHDAFLQTHPVPANFRR
jgi:predicted Zn-dependent protease